VKSSKQASVLMLASMLSLTCSRGVRLTEIQQQLHDRGEPVVFTGEVVTLELRTPKAICVDPGSNCSGNPPRVECLQSTAWTGAEQQPTADGGSATWCCKLTGTIRVKYTRSSRPCRAQGLLFERNDAPPQELFRFSVDVPDELADVLASGAGAGAAANGKTSSGGASGADGAGR
jgi:hypothetical protein